jgi:hypothetical protein
MPINAMKMPMHAAVLRQDLRVHHHDVGHGDERSQTAEQFLADRSLIFCELEPAFQQAARLRLAGRDVGRRRWHEACHSTGALAGKSTRIPP